MMEDEKSKMEIANEERQNLRTSLSAPNSVLQQTPAPIFENEAGTSHVHSHRMIDEETMRLWLLQKSDHTVRAYSRIGDEFMEYVTSLKKTLPLVQPEDVLNFVSFKKSWSDATQAQRGAAIKSLYSFGTKSGRLNSNPTMILKLRTPQTDASSKVPSVDEMGQLLQACKTDKQIALIRLMYDTAARRSEIINLNWKAFRSLPNGEALVGILGKGNKLRELRIQEETWLAVQALKTDAAKATDPVFTVKYKGGIKRISQSWLYNQVSEIARRAGIEKALSPHSLRHAHATHALNAGAPIKLLQDTLGHSSIEMSARYAHSNPRESSGRYLALNKATKLKE